MIVSGLSTSALRSETPPSSAEAADATAYNPEMLIVAMERVMVLFDRSALSCCCFNALDSTAADSPA